MQAGDTLVRNTLRGGKPITDIENDEAALGDYTDFCGYFLVDPAKHKLKGNEARLMMMRVCNDECMHSVLRAVFRACGLN